MVINMELRSGIIGINHVLGSDLMGSDNFFFAFYIAKSHLPNLV